MNEETLNQFESTIASLKETSDSALLAIDILQKMIDKEKNIRIKIKTNLEKIGIEGKRK